MVDIQTERVLNAVIDALFDDTGDDCPKKRMAYQIMENLSQVNNQAVYANPAKRMYAMII